MQYKPVPSGAARVELSLSIHIPSRTMHPGDSRYHERRNDLFSSSNNHATTMIQR